MKRTLGVNSEILIEKEDMYRQIVEYSFETTVLHADHEILYINQSGADFLKGTKEEIIGACILDVFQDDHKDFIKERIRQASIENKIGELIEQTIIKLDGTLVDVELYCHPVMFGDKKAIQSILRDITSRKEAEKKLKEVMNDVITPIVPISDGIAVIPIVGLIDKGKANQLLECIPPRLQMHKLNYLIIDFSGIYNLDTTVVEFLFNINSIMKLLGIYPILTGLRPELARKAVEMGHDLSSLKTISNVKQALKQIAK